MCVIIIKLAIAYIIFMLYGSPEKAKTKRKLDIYPIAHRLGMNQIKSELEDLSLRYYKPDIYFRLWKC